MGEELQPEDDIPFVVYYYGGLKEAAYSTLQAQGGHDYIKYYWYAPDGTTLSFLTKEAFTSGWLASVKEEDHIDPTMCA